MKKTKFIQQLQNSSIKQRTEEWYKQRSKMITASDCGVILGYNYFKNMNELLSSKLNDIKIDNIYMRHGNHYEPIAVEIFQKKMKETVFEIGLLVHKKYKYLGASPDGITSKHFLIEIKCPCSRLITGSISLHYYAQVQLQLEVADLEQCYFYECAFKEVNTKTECKNKEFYGYNEQKQNWWYLNNDNLMIIPRDKDWFKRNQPKFKNFFDELTYQQRQQKKSNSRKRKLSTDFSHCISSKKRKIVKTKNNNLKWINESKIRNFCIGDTLCDWLDLYGDKNDFEKEPNNPFTLLKFKKTNQFKTKILYEIEQNFKKYCQRLPQNFGNFSIDIKLLTEQYMKNGIPIIIHGMISDDDEKIYTVVDLLIRSDWLSKVFNKYKLKCNMNGLSSYNDNWFYTTVSIKYKILPFSSNGITLSNDAVMRMYKAQSAFRNKILAKTQFYKPNTTFIVGSGWKFTKNGEKFNRYNDWKRLGYIKLNEQDKNYIDSVNNALIWYRDVEKNGKKWKILPKPTRKELYPLILSNSPGYWGSVKKKIAIKLKEISLLWQVGPSIRQKAHNENIYTWDNPKLSPQILGFKKNTNKSIILQKIIDINKMKRTKILPKKIENNCDDWKNPNRVEFYVDFETLNSLYGGKSIIYLIGLTVIIPEKLRKKYKTNNKERFYNFIAESLTKGEEYRIIEEWFKQMKSILTKYQLNREDVNCYCWSNAENSFLNSARKRHDKVNSSKWKIKFTDVMDIIRTEPVVIKGCLSGFGLKAVSSAMYNNDMITIKYDSKCTSGEVSMASAVNYYEHKYKEEMDDIVRYNKLDCNVIYEILTYLRKHHS